MLILTPLEHYWNTKLILFPKNNITLLQRYTKPIRISNTKRVHVTPMLLKIVIILLDTSSFTDYRTFYQVKIILFATHILSIIQVSNDMFIILPVNSI